MNAHGKVTSQLLTNGLITQLADYHPATGQMTEVKSVLSAGASNRHWLTYSYDGFSNLMTHIMTGANNATSTEDYDYDGLHRLTRSYQLRGQIYFPHRQPLRSPQRYEIWHHRFNAGL